MDFHLNDIPAPGTRVHLITKRGERFTGRIRHATTNCDGQPIVGVIEGAGWWTIELRHISTLKVLPPQPGRPGSPPESPRARLAFAA